MKQVIAALCVLLLVATVSVHAADSESVSESGVSMVHEMAEGAKLGAIRFAFWVSRMSDVNCTCEYDAIRIYLFLTYCLVESSLS